MNLSKLIASTTIALGATLAAVPTAGAVPISGNYLEDARCDVIPNQHLTHELGDAATFPPNEALLISLQQVNFTVCVPDDGVANDWIVQIQNVSGTAWQDLFFVVDFHVVVGNADGMMEDAIGAPGVFTDAFRIDGTVTAGANNNLLFESGPVDEVLQPGEIWRFAVSNFVAVTSAGLQPPILITPGIFAGSAPFPNTPGNCSILANPVPEPAISAGLLVAAGALLHRRKRASASS
jgi:hypothetical protein